LVVFHGAPSPWIDLTSFLGDSSFVSLTPGLSLEPLVCVNVEKEREREREIALGPLFLLERVCV
jgi:hypothetical protein